MSLGKIEKGEMIPCGKRFMVEAAVRGFRFAQLPGYLEIFPVGKVGGERAGCLPAAPTSTR